MSMSMSALHRATRIAKPTATAWLRSPLPKLVSLSRGATTLQSRPFSSTTASRTQSQSRSPKSPSTSPLGPLGVEAALKASTDPSFQPRPTLQKEFDLTGRVAVVSGANRGLGLEMAETLCEAGATVYCLDLRSQPGKEWIATRDYVSRLGLNENARLEYKTVDVTNQKAIWDIVAEIGDKEKRMDVCIAAAGILEGYDCLEYPLKLLVVRWNDLVHRGVLFLLRLLKSSFDLTHSD